METLLHVAIFVLEVIGGAIILTAASVSLFDLVSTWIRMGPRENIELIRLRLSQRLVLALEFLIAADILATLHTPKLEGIALLAAVIVLRTVLSLSISYELRKSDSDMQW